MLWISSSSVPGDPKSRQSDTDDEAGGSGTDGPSGVDIASVNATKETTSKMRRRHFSISGIAYIFLRRYRLRDSALEVLFQQGSPQKSFFIDFGHTKQNMKTRNTFARRLMEVALAVAEYLVLLLV